jgi:hypothetical protein
MIKLKLGEITAGSLTLSRVHRMNPNTVGTYFNILEKVATKNNLSDTSGNIFSIVESFIKSNDKPDCVVTEKKSKNLHFVTPGGKSENISVITRYYNCKSISTPILIYNDSNKEHEIGDGLPPGIDV